MSDLSEIAKTLSKATNVHNGGYGYYSAIEKFIVETLKSDGLREIGFNEVCDVASHLLPSNIGTNSFHRDLEKFLILKFNEDNLQNIVELIKSLSLYTIKEKELYTLL